MFERAASAFLFDMDGTLIDSIAAAERIWGRWAAAHGLDVPAFLKTIHGFRALDTIARLGLPGVDPVVEARWIEREEIDDVEGVVPIPGAIAFLASLPPERWTIVTSAPRRLAAARLAKAGVAVPPTLVAAEDVTAGKPAPDGFLLGAQRLGFDAATCIVFEDSLPGIRAGEAAGAGVIVVGGARSPYPAIRSYDEVSVLVEPDGLRLRIAAPQGAAEA